MYTRKFTFAAGNYLDIMVRKTYIRLQFVTKEKFFHATFVSIKEFFNLLFFPRSENDRGTILKDYYIIYIYIRKL